MEHITGKQSQHTQKRQMLSYYCLIGLREEWTCEREALRDDEMLILNSEDANKDFSSVRASSKPLTIC